MKKIFFIILLALNVSACTGVGGTLDWKKPVALKTNPPEGPYNYRKGWLDGCTSGIASTNTSLHMTIGSQKFTLDERLRYDSLYNAAWRYGYNHCGYSMKSLAQYNF